jgi:hypothetical protein
MKQLGIFILAVANIMDTTISSLKEIIKHLLTLLKNTKTGFVDVVGLCTRKKKSVKGGKDTDLRVFHHLHALLNFGLFNLALKNSFNI